MKEDIFKLSNYDFKIPRTLIAQEPLAKRDESRLLIIRRKDKSFQEIVFKDIVNFLNSQDVLVLNDTRVIKARLLGRKTTGAKIDVLLVRQKSKGVWEVLAKPRKRLKKNDTIVFGENQLTAKVLEAIAGGAIILEFFPKEISPLLETIGKPPLPHYIKKEIDDFEKYQTTYAKKQGAIAAPTAGFHFTPELLAQIQKKGVRIVHLTLHCGLATFQPVKSEDIRSHILPQEEIEVSKTVENAVNLAKQAGSRVIAVGTTAIRTLESAAFLNENNEFRIKAFRGETNLYITPGYKFKIIDAALTNFHTPCSSNLILTSCFCGLDLLRQAYDYAAQQKFRFFSFGDAMLIL
jgi:S-adenosylmethionine:tRNA ribosyltransferase-isomerase